MLPIIGQTIVAVKGDDSGPTIVYTPWAPRGGNAGVFVLDVIASSQDGNQSIKLEVQTKNSEDTDTSADTLSGSVILSGQGTDSKRFSAFEELFRVKFTLTPDAGLSNGETVFAHLRALSPSWETN